jgi:carbon starvation protein CstA
MNKHLTRLRYFLQEQWLLFVLSRSFITIGLFFALVGAVYAVFHFKVNKTYPWIMVIPYGFFTICTVVLCISMTDENTDDHTPLKQKARKILSERGETLLPGELGTFTAFLVCSTWGREEKSVHEAAVLETRTSKATTTRRTPRL